MRKVGTKAVRSTATHSKDTISQIQCGHKNKNVDADEYNETGRCSTGALLGGTNNGHDEFTDDHQDRAVDAESTAAKFLGDVEGDGG